MGKLDEDFEIESTVDLDNIDEKAAEALLKRGAPRDEIEVEEVPDERIAEKDRQAKPLPAEDNPEPSEEELAAYSEGVRKRIEKLTHARHDERREKEQATRERDEAIQFAQQALERANSLEKRAGELTAQNQDTTLSKVEADIAAARKELTDATNSYDTEAMVDANLKLADLVAQKRELTAQKNSRAVAQAEKDVVQQQPSTRPAPDKRAQDWVARNGAWFQKDKAMTAFAFGVHEDLVSRGVDPRVDADLYYKQLDEQVKSRFPEKFEADPKPNTTPRSSPVAPATRTVNGRRKVTLTSTEMNLARRLGVTPEQFAAEKIKLENRNG